MANEAGNSGLEVDVGITLNKLVAQLAAAEARMAKAAKKFETDFDKANNGALSRTTKKLEEIGNEANRATMKAATGLQRMSASFSSSRGAIQNTAFQLQDFAVQVGAGTAASTALAMQLPQLLGGFGALGAVIGAVVAIGIPLAAAFFRSGEAAKSATDAVDDLEAALKRLQEINDIYSTEGLQAVIDKYGELNAEILLLIERQRQFAMDAAILAARDAATSLKGEMQGLLNSLQTYRDYMVAGDATSLVLAADEAAALEEQFGITVIQAEALELAINAAMRTDKIDTMASAMASVTSVIEDSTLKGSELAGALLDSESALRALNAEASGIGGWLGAAIAGASTFAAELWNAADAARAAAMESGPTARGGRTSNNGPAGAPQIISVPQWDGPSPPNRPEDIDFGYTPPSRTGGSSGGGSPGSSEPAYWDDLVRSVQRAQDEFERFNETAEQGANTMSDLFTSIVDGSMTAREALASLLVQLAKVQMQKGFLGLSQTGGFLAPVASALGGALSVPSFAGGGDTGMGARSGGLDGQGGFMAMIHPQETVLDRSKGQAHGGVVELVLHAADGVTVEQMRNTANAVIRQSAPAIIQSASDITLKRLGQTKANGRPI